MSPFSNICLNKSCFVRSSTIGRDAVFLEAIVVKSKSFEYSKEMLLVMPWFR